MLNEIFFWGGRISERPKSRIYLSQCLCSWRSISKQEPFLSSLTTPVFIFLNFLTPPASHNLRDFRRRVSLLLALIPRGVRSNLARQGALGFCPGAKIISFTSIDWTRSQRRRHSYLIGTVGSILRQKVLKSGNKPRGGPPRPV